VGHHVGVESPRQPLAELPVHEHDDGPVDVDRRLLVLVDGRPDVVLCHLDVAVVVDDVDAGLLRERGADALGQRLLPDATPRPDRDRVRLLRWVVGIEVGAAAVAVAAAIAAVAPGTSRRRTQRDRTRAREEAPAGGTPRNVPYRSDPVRVVRAVPRHVSAL
jgi:hypothetical protein